MRRGIAIDDGFDTQSAQTYRSVYLSLWVCFSHTLDLHLVLSCDWR